ncbi:endonuclease/exonuclease/phosphatase family protein [Actinophytocola oryzae]|uniref:Endonuclease/exonuclease/phosphatase (EEP) superfamily protein YafD n=1 Tax=Actinophytocola oryzae TaxID=502181 RepID=A0A4R7V032_9PSEU|nr:endonuclease/exonuclease/phosphatase family protein [Actinophytocola oryzae]TDV40726.1 endonuclease/exonuclease/phosphatase (EEP) superfamily protein YafD [Actinophytocola oryzae]
MVRWTEAPDEYTHDLADPNDDDFDVDHPARRRRSRTVTFLLVLAALVFLAYGVARVLSVDDLVDNALLVDAMALTPYVVAGSLLLALVSLVLRRLLALVVLVLALSLSALLGPRYFSEEQPEATGPHLRIMAANLYLGHADARTIVNLVRQQQVDVLTMPELTPAEVSALDSAGLSELLPYRVFDARPGGDGNGIAANVPLRRVVPMSETVLSQPSALVDLPGRDDVQLTAVHIQPPLSYQDVRTWRSELAQLPRVEPNDHIRILAGDFNATFDHAAFRNIVDRGYADAAEETGKGLDTTWSSLPTGPPLTIDHIVADGQCAISSYAVYDLPGSDHNAIIAEVVLP